PLPNPAVAPPPPTAVPYTTLFRSATAERSRRTPSTQEVALSPKHFQPPHSPKSSPTEKAACFCQTALNFPEDLRALRGPSLRTLDRKSTRLNSSHGSTSYAVFCLK